MEQRAVMSDCETGEQIIEACQKGDREAFRLLYEAYKNRVYSTALYFFGGDEASAADIMQQVFLKLFTKIEQFRSEAEFTTWLYRLAANACIDEQRKRSRFSFFGDASEMRDVGEKKSQEEQIIRIEMAEAVQQAVAALRPKLRLAILLKYFEDLSYEEMAAVLGCSKGTVASRLNRGHKILAQRLGYLRETLVRGEQKSNDVR